MTTFDHNRINVLRFAMKRLLRDNAFDFDGDVTAEMIVAVSGLSGVTDAEIDEAVARGGPDFSPVSRDGSFDRNA